MSSQYPQDEFDRVGEDMPVGMHRPQPSRWKSVLPFLVILVVVPLLGWGASQLLTGLGGTQSDDGGTVAQSTQSDDAAQSDQRSASPAETSVDEPQSEATPTPTPSETESEPQSGTAEVDYNVKIAVLNGTAIVGHAAEYAVTLNEAGFPGTTVDNAGDWLSQTSVVYYASPDLEATAQEIARVLGIDTVELNTTDLGDFDVTVLLR